MEPVSFLLGTVAGCIATGLTTCWVSGMCREPLLDVVDKRKVFAGEPPTPIPIPAIPAEACIGTDAYEAACASFHFATLYVATLHRGEYLPSFSLSKDVEQKHTETTLETMRYLNYVPLSWTSRVHMVDHTFQHSKYLMKRSRYVAMFSLGMRYGILERDSRGIYRRVKVVTA